ncbi:MAG: hypothetical protein RL534_70 [Actinomycetota bacterium]
MFGDVGFGELLGLGILALLLVGPDRLPTVALEAAPGYENLKPQDLHPKNFIKKQINEAMVDQPKKLNAKVKLDPDML